MGVSFCFHAVLREFYLVTELDIDLMKLCLGLAPQLVSILATKSATSGGAFWIVRSSLAVCVQSRKVLARVVPDVNIHGDSSEDDCESPCMGKAVAQIGSVATYPTPIATDRGDFI